MADLAGSTSTDTPAHVRVDGAGREPFLAAVDEIAMTALSRHAGPVADAALATYRAGGKRLRPLLVHEARPVAAPVRTWQEVAAPAAASIELVHAATLVHDDILDGAEIRRGQPTVVARDGREAAVAVGDLMFAVAFQLLLDRRTNDLRIAPCVGVLARAARDLAEGEALQARQQWDTELSEDAYLERCAGKTGVLFGAAMELSAIAGDADDVVRSHLRGFGVSVGVAFQLVDDLLDCSGSEATLGKVPGADLRDGTITLPMLTAMRQSAQLRTMLASRRPDVQTALELVRATDAIGHTRDRAIDLVATAITSLEPVRGAVDQDALDRVARMSIERIT